MSQYVAAALAGVEADDADEAFDLAKYNVHNWEVTGVTPVEDIGVTLGPAIDVAAASDPRDEPLILGFQRRPLFGKASLIGGPLLAYGAIADTSAIRAAVSALAAISFG